MKRLLSGILIVVVLLISTMAHKTAAYSDLMQGSEIADAVENLVAYGIFEPSQTGFFLPHQHFTRAELAKIAVLVSGLEQTMAGTRFSDVPENHWANGYIGAASANGLLIAFPGGKFKPEDKVSYEQAVTVVLRLLGYDSGNVKGNWPEGMIQKARELGLSKGIEQQPGTLITRGNAAILLDRALMTKVWNNSAFSRDRLLLEKMGYRVMDNIVVIASKAEDQSLLDGEVKTSHGTYLSLIDAQKMVSRKGKAILNSDSEVVHFIPQSQKFEKHVLSGWSKKYLSFKGGRKINVDNETIVFYRGRKLKFTDFYDEIKSKMNVWVYFTQSDAVDYLFVTDEVREND